MGDVIRDSGKTSGVTGKQIVAFVSPRKISLIASWNGVPVVLWGAPSVSLKNMRSRKWE